MGSFKDITGMEFNRLTVIKRAEDRITPGGVKLIRWLCECSCGSGKEVIANAYDLKTGHTKSCGCLSIEKQYESHKKYNKYDLTGEYGIGYTEKEEPFYFDLEDYDKIKDHHWRYNPAKYVVTDIGGKRVRFHRIILDLKDIREGDHIFFQNFDNRKSQIRVATKSQNNMNHRLRSDNTSGIKGVHWSNRDNVWVGQIDIKGEHFYKSSPNKEEIITWRAKKEKDLFGEFAFIGEGSAQCLI